jgi:antitoxin HicB
MHSKTASEFYFDDRRPVPVSSQAKGGQSVVESPTSLAVKILLLNEALYRKVRPTELVRKTGTTA